MFDRGHGGFRTGLIGESAGTFFSIKWIHASIQLRRMSAACGGWRRISRDRRNRFFH